VTILQSDVGTVISQQKQSNSHVALILWGSADLCDDFALFFMQIASVVVKIL